MTDTDTTTPSHGVRYMRYRYIATRRNRGSHRSDQIKALDILAHTKRDALEIAVNWPGVDATWRPGNIDLLPVDVAPQHMPDGVTGVFWD